MIGWRSGLDDALEAGAMGVVAGAADRVDDGIDVVALPQRVEGGERHADLGPEGAQDQLAPPGGAHGGEEFGVLPRVGRRPVDRRVVLEQFGELGHGRLPRPVATLIVEWTIGIRNAFAVFTVETMFSSSRSRIHRADRGELRRLVVDHDERAFCGVSRWSPTGSRTGRLAIRGAPRSRSRGRGGSTASPGTSRSR